MNCMWYEDISLETMADALELTPERLCQKIFQEVEFTEEEIQKVTALLGLTDDEVYMIFYK